MKHGVAGPFLVVFAVVATFARVWLLLYSGVTVARSMMIPHGIEEWKLSFRFDRVFWFAALEGQFAEIQRAEAPNTVGS